MKTTHASLGRLAAVARRRPARVVFLLLVIGCKDSAGPPTSTVAKGAVQVTVTTTGTDLPTGYSVGVDSGTPSAVGANSIQRPHVVARWREDRVRWRQRR